MSYTIPKVKNSCIYSTHTPTHTRAQARIRTYTQTTRKMAHRICKKTHQHTQKHAHASRKAHACKTCKRTQVFKIMHKNTHSHGCKVPNEHRCTHKCPKHIQLANPAILNTIYYNLFRKLTFRWSCLGCYSGCDTFTSSSFFFTCFANIRKYTLAGIATLIIVKACSPIQAGV